MIQFQSDLIQRPVIRPKSIETTVLGAAYLAGLAWGYKNDIRKQWQSDKTFKPQMDPGKLTKGWNCAVKAAIAWADDR